MTIFPISPHCSPNQVNREHSFKIVNSDDQVIMITTTALEAALAHEGKTCLDLVRVLYKPGARAPAELRGVLTVISHMLDLEEEREQMFRPGAPGYVYAKQSFEDACAE